MRSATCAFACGESAPTQYFEFFLRARRTPRETFLPLRASRLFVRPDVPPLDTGTGSGDVALRGLGVGLEIQFLE